MANNELTRSENEMAERAFKAYFMREYGIKDTIIRPYANNIIVDKESLEKLNENICGKLMIHSNSGFLTDISIRYHNKKIIEIPSWKEFKEFGWFEDSPVDSIVINWKFNAVFNEDSHPQLHILTVKLSNGLRPEELLNLLLSSEFSETNKMDTNFFPVVAQVTFTDRRFANELINIVSEWVDVLSHKQSNRNKIMIVLQKHKRRIADTIKFLSFTLMFIFLSIFGILSLKKILPQELSSISRQNIIDGMILLFLLIYILKAINWMSQFFAKSIFNILRDYGNSYIFNLSIADAERQNKMIEQEKYDKIKLVLNLVFAFLINLIYYAVNNIFDFLIK